MAVLFLYFFPFGSFEINLVNIYAPTNLTDCKVFFENLHEFFIPADYIIVAGDFNCYEREIDKFGGNFTPAEYLSDFRSALRFVDAFRRLHPRSRKFSWFNSDFSIATRLDKFFVSSNFVPLLQSCGISPCCLSDHDFVFLQFVLNDNFARGPGLWKFNNSLLFVIVFLIFRIVLIPFYPPALAVLHLKEIILVLTTLCLTVLAPRTFICPTLTFQPTISSLKLVLMAFFLRMLNVYNVTLPDTLILLSLMIIFVTLF